MHRHTLAFPIDVAPAQRKMFGRAAQAAEAAERENQFPLRVGARIDNLFGIAAANEILALWWNEP